MKYILIILTFFMLFGCEDDYGNKLYPYQIAEAERRCSTNDGLEFIRSSPIYYKAGISVKHTEVNVGCNNGATFWLRLVHPDSQ